MARVRAFAPAKINLALHVGPPRADGRHELASVIAFADVGDWIELDESGAGLTVDGPFAAALAGENDNLVSRALTLVAGDRAPGVRLEKNLPVASGIGGGSADAAAALRAARMLFALPHADQALEQIAARLGSDVPACVSSRSAIMRGAGEVLTPVALPPLFAVLVNPGAPLSTAAVYRRFDERANWGQLDLPPCGPTPTAAIAALAGMRNDLEPAGADLAPPVGAALEALRNVGEVRLARMSGSGATCFGLTDDFAAAQSAAALLRQRQPDWWICATRLGEIDVAPRQV